MDSTSSAPARRNPDVVRGNLLKDRIFRRAIEVALQVLPLPSSTSTLYCSFCHMDPVPTASPDDDHGRYHSLQILWPSTIITAVSHISRGPQIAGELIELSVILYGGRTASTETSIPTHPSTRRPYASQAFLRRWSRFSQNLTGQWQAMNYVSAVLVGTIATMLQDPTIFNHTVGRTCVTAAFLCALASLCSGSMLSIHVSNLRSVREAVVWTINAHGLSSKFCFNPAAVLAAPAVWLIWSLLFFVITLIASYVWQPPDIETYVASRVAVGCVLVVWLAQTISTVWTLHKLKAVPSSGLDGIPDVDLDLETGWNSMS